MSNLTSLDLNNHTVSQDEAFENKFRYVMGALNLYIIPILVGVGVFTNILSVVVFTTTHLRLQASSVYLASLAVADSGYLLALFVGWFGWIDIHLFHRPFWCQTVVYVTYVCSFISVWNVASFTIERYLVVCHPFKLTYLSSVRSAVIVVSCEALFACIMYSYNLWTSHVVYYGNQSYCSTKEQFASYVSIMVHIDTVITLVIPSLIIVLLNIKLYITVYRLLRTKNSDTTAETYSSSVTTSASNRGSDESKTSQRSTFSTINTPRCPQLRTTRMLLIVSTVFVLLNMPSYAFKVYAVISQLIVSDYFPSAALFRWQEILHFPYYINFAINFFLYSASRKAFRSALGRLVSRYKYNVKQFYNLFIDKLCTTDYPQHTHATIVEDGGGAYVYVKNIKKPK